MNAKEDFELPPDRPLKLPNKQEVLFLSSEKQAQRLSQNTVHDSGEGQLYTP